MSDKTNPFFDLEQSREAAIPTITLRAQWRARGVLVALEMAQANRANRRGWKGSFPRDEVSASP